MTRVASEDEAPTRLASGGRTNAAHPRMAIDARSRFLTTPRTILTIPPLILIGGLVHRSEEHTSELQSLRHLVCRLLLEKKRISNKYTEYLRLMGVRSVGGFRVALC